MVPVCIHTAIRQKTHDTHIVIQLNNILGRLQHPFPRSSTIVWSKYKRLTTFARRTLHTHTHTPHTHTHTHTRPFSEAKYRKKEGRFISVSLFAKSGRVLHARPFCGRMVYIWLMPTPRPAFPHSIYICCSQICRSVWLYFGWLCFASSIASCRKLQPHTRTKATVWCNIAFSHPRRGSPLSLIWKLYLSKYWFGAR